MTNTLNDIKVSLQTEQSSDADTILLRAFYLNAVGRVSSPADCIRPTNNSIAIDLRSVPEGVSKIVFTITLSDTHRTFGKGDPAVQIAGIGTLENMEFSHYLESSNGYRALIFGEVIRSNNGWTWNRITRDSNDTLEEIAKRYGCDIPCTIPDHPSPPTPKAKAANDRIISNRYGDTYNLKQQKNKHSDFEIWTVAYRDSHEKSEGENGQLLLANPHMLSCNREDLLTNWEQLVSKPGHAGTVVDNNMYKNWLFAYVKVSDVPANVTSDICCVWNILQEITSLQKKGLSYETLEDWMFTDHDGKTECRLIPNHLLRSESDHSDMPIIAGKYLQKRYPDLPQPWKGLLQRLTDDSLDIKLLLNKRIWQEKHKSLLVYPEQLIQRKRNGTDYVLEWPQDKTIFILQGDTSLLSKYQVNTIYVRDEFDEKEVTKCPIRNPNVIKGQELETITVLPFLVSEPLFQCLEPILLGGPEDVPIESVSWNARAKVLVLSIAWPSDTISGARVIVRNDRRATHAGDFSGHVHYCKNAVRGGFNLPVECDLKPQFSDQVFSDKLFVSIFSYQLGKNGCLYSTTGYHREVVLPSRR